MNLRTFSFTTVLLAGATSALAAPTVAATMSTNAMPSCAHGDPVVWENTASKSKAYHVRGDRYFGTTKHGSYVCQSDATKAGYHAASAHGGKGATAAGSDSTASPTPGFFHKKRMLGTPPPDAGASGAPDATSPDASASPAAHHKHHRKHHGTAPASPDPSAT